MKKIKWGIIGLGWFGEYHGDALAGLPNAEVYALCTRTESRLKELGAKFGAKKLYTDYNEMLADPELDVVSVTTMWDQHAEPTLAALKAGKHVFLEKPMASTRGGLPGDRRRGEGDRQVLHGRPHRPLQPALLGRAA